MPQRIQYKVKEAVYRMRENICKYIRESVNIWNISRSSTSVLQIQQISQLKMSKGLDIFFHRTNRNIPKHMKWFSITLIMSGMQLNLLWYTIFFFFFPKQNKYWWGHGKTGIFMEHLWECKVVQSLWKTAESSFKN